MGWTHRSFIVTAAVLLALATAVRGQRFPRRAVPAWRADGECPKLDECPAGATKSVLLIGVDGFRPDYMRWYRARGQALRAFSHCGVRARFLRPVFPTNTFPNFYTIATGLYPESHGIVDNNFYDPAFNESFDLGEESAFNPKFWGGEPIWNTAKRQGKRTATMFWPGSDVKIGGSYPDAYHVYNSSVTLDERVSQVLSWMAQNETRPHFVTLYMNEPDRTGHRSGPESTQIAAAFEAVDLMLDTLMEGLFELGVLPCVDVLLVSDHGMMHSGCDKMIPISSVVPEDFYALTTREYYGATGRFELANEVKDREGAVLDNMGCSSHNVRAYSKKTLPRRLHYGGKNARIESIILDLDPGYALVDDDTDWCMKGRHGWDPIHRSMNAYFAAFGNSFRSAEASLPFENIEIYNLMCYLLDIKPAANNGTQGSLFHLLKDAEQPQAYSKLDPADSPLSGRREDLEFVYIDSGDSVEGCGCQLAPSRRKRQAAAPEAGEDAIVQNALESHLPWGIPVAFDEDNQKDLSMTYLTQQSYVMGFSKKLNLPLWASYVISAVQGQHQQGGSGSSSSESGARPPPNNAAGSTRPSPEAKPSKNRQKDEPSSAASASSGKKTTSRSKRQAVPTDPRQTSPSTSGRDAGCWILDPRLPELSAKTCALSMNISSRDYPLSYDSLLPAELFEDDRREGSLTSSLIALRTHFSDTVKSAVIELLEAWLESYKSLQITSGPVFDYDGDGLKDDLSSLSLDVPPAPSHVFYVVKRCLEDPEEVTLQNCPEESLDLVAMVLPNDDDNVNCETPVEFLNQHSARVRDIELLTGLYFPQADDPAENLRLRTKIPGRLWPMASKILEHPPVVANSAE